MSSDSEPRQALDAVVSLVEDRARLGADASGTPAGLLGLLCRRGELEVLDSPPAEGTVVVDYPFGALWQQATGCVRFVQLGGGPARYALIRE